MDGIVGVVGGGAPRDHLQGRVVIHDDDVVDVLNGLVRVEHHAGLDGVSDVVPGLDPDEVSVRVLEVGLGGVLVLRGVHGLPEVVLQTLVPLQGLLDGAHLQSLLGRGAAVARSVVDEQKGSGAVHLVSDDSYALHVLLVIRALEVVDGDRLLAPLAVVVEVDIGSERPLLGERVLHSLIILLWHPSHSPYPFFLMSLSSSSGFPLHCILPFFMT